MCTRRADCITCSTLSFIEQIYAQMSSLMIEKLTNALVAMLSVAYTMHLYLANKTLSRIIYDPLKLRKEEPACDETTSQI